MHGVLPWVVIGASLLLVVPSALQRSRRSRAPAYDAVVIRNRAIGDAPGELERATDADLFRAWQVSQFRVQREALTPYYDKAGFARIVATRGLLLDELERRHPERFATWMSAGPDAVVHPDMFLASHAHRWPRR
jgi:hypothetical protein